MTHLDRLLRLLGRGAAPEDNAAAERIESARASVHKWKTRADEQTRRASESDARLADSQQALREAKARAGSLYREVPSVDVIRGTFVHRLRTMRARLRAEGSSERKEREERLLQASPAYRATFDAGPDSLRTVAEQIAVDGLAWWVPPGSGEQRLPFRGILQTREVATGGIMLDLGANIGRMAIPRVVLGDVSAAYCAEPDPVNFACLARTVVDNGLRGLVLPDQTAIGDRNGTVRLLREGSSGNFHVQPDGAGASASDSVEVPCCTLDTWVERLRIDLEAVTFVKVDVKGFERRVVAGAPRVLACRHIAWQMEIKPAGLRGAGDEPGALYADLAQAFTHFIDLNRRASGKRVRPVAELGDALAYVEPRGKTDVLLFAADGIPA